MGKISVSETKGKQRHNPLYADISEQGGNLRVRARGRAGAGAAQTARDDGYLDAATSRKILQLAKAQQQEVEDEEGDAAPRVQFSAAAGDASSDDEDYSSFEVEEYEEAEAEDFEVDAADAAMFEEYLTASGGGAGGAGRAGGAFNLADRILAKIEEAQSQRAAPTGAGGADGAGDAGARPEDAVLLPPKVIAAYEKIGQILATYTHGKLPKLFKVLPTLRNWEDVLYVTNPEAWTPHAVFEATKLFVLNLQAPEAQKFVEAVLLERFRSCIEETEDHLLNYHLYRALKKLLYKPAAFFKGFLMPLVDGACLVREATIAALVLAKVLVPVLHSLVALTQLVQREFRPLTTVFIRVLIEKKYALPYQTLDEVVFYFMRFRRAEAGDAAPALPVVWHKAFLLFAQRYKNDITEDQRDFLLETVRQRFHAGIGPEIRRELLAGEARVTLGKEVAMIDA
jgi:essential nuclear protein 1